MELNKLKLNLAYVDITPTNFTSWSSIILTHTSHTAVCSKLDRLLINILIYFHTYILKGFLFPDHY